MQLRGEKSNTSLDWFIVVVTKNLCLTRLLKGPLGSQTTAGQIFEEHTRDEGREEETLVQVARK